MKYKVTEMRKIIQEHRDLAIFDMREKGNTLKYVGERFDLNGNTVRLIHKKIHRKSRHYWQVWEDCGYQSFNYLLGIDKDLRNHYIVT